jgi:hypothetical protein
MHISYAAGAVLALAMSMSGAAAQQPLLIGGQTGPILRMGTEVPVRTQTELTTQNKALRVGQRFDVETSEPVSLNGQVVIPAGTPGVGEITSVRNKGMWGKSGHFDARLLFLRVGDRQIRLSGTTDDKGKAGGVGAAAVSAIVFLPAGFFMTGTSARIPAGSTIKGFLDEDVPVAFAAGSAPAPLAVAAPAGPVVAPAAASGTILASASQPQ